MIEAAAVAGEAAVRADVNDEFDTERLKVKIVIGGRSTIVILENVDVDYVTRDDAVHRKVAKQIREALADLQRGAS